MQTGNWRIVDITEDPVPTFGADPAFQGSIYVMAANQLIMAGNQSVTIRSVGAITLSALGAINMAATGASLLSSTGVLTLSSALVLMSGAACRVDSTSFVINAPSYNVGQLLPLPVRPIVIMEITSLLANVTLAYVVNATAAISLGGITALLQSTTLTTVNSVLGAVLITSTTTTTITSGSTVAITAQALDATMTSLAGDAKIISTLGSAELTGATVLISATSLITIASTATTLMTGTGVDMEQPLIVGTVGVNKNLTVNGSATATGEFIGPIGM